MPPSRPTYMCWWLSQRTVSDSTAVVPCPCSTPPDPPARGFAQPPSPARHFVALHCSPDLWKTNPSPIPQPFVFSRSAGFTQSVAHTSPAFLLPSATLGAPGACFTPGVNVHSTHGPTGKEAAGLCGGAAGLCSGTSSHGRAPCCCCHVCLGVFT